MNDLSSSHRVSEELQYGIIGINDKVLVQVEGSFGGVKGGGLGIEEGPEHWESI